MLWRVTSLVSVLFSCSYRFSTGLGANSTDKGRCDGMAFTDLYLQRLLGFDCR
jgi:hypothetical protein